MKQKNKNRRSQEEKRMEVLKSGLCNELVAGVVDENATLGASVKPDLQGGKQPDLQGGVESVQMNLSEDEILSYIENCRGNCGMQTPTVGSLLCRVFDLVQRQNQLMEIVNFYSAKYGENPSSIANEAFQMPQNQMGQNQMSQYPNMQNQMGQNQMPQGYEMPIPQGGKYQTQGESMPFSRQMPKSTGSTRQTMKKRGFIPKSQVDKMTREEIREMFDLIDKSRKEW